MRLSFLLPLLMIVVAITPVPAAAQSASCMNHDQTLVVHAADTIPVFTSFETSPNCIYEIEASGQYIDNDKAADAFYSADPGCNAEKYAANGATRCVHFDFGQSTHGWTAQPWGTSYATWSPGIGWEAAMGLQSIIPVNGMLIVSPPPLLGSMRLVAFESISVYKPGKWNTGGTPAVHLNLPFAWWPTSSPMTNLAYAAPSPSSVAVPALQWTARVGSATGGLNPPGEASLTTLTVWWAGTSNGWEADTWSASDNLDSNAAGSRPAYSPEHEYSWQLPGIGAAFDFLINDRNANRADNIGTLTIRVRAVSETPANIFRRPLEFGDVSADYDWYDTNGSPDPSGTHCDRVSDALNVLTGWTSCQQIKRIALDHVDNVVIQASGKQNAPVHAVSAGTVIERRSLLPYECYDMTIYYAGPPYNGNGCLLEIPNWATANNKALFIESVASPIYVVRVRHDDNSEMRYLVTNPRVAAGQSIRDSCVLGETIPMRLYSSIAGLRSMFTEHYINALPDASEPPIWNLFADIIDTSSAGPGGVVVMGYAKIAQDNLEFLGPPFTYYSRLALEDYSSPADSCDISSNFANCKSTNPQFMREGEYWLTTAGSPVWSNPGVILEPGAKIYLPNLPLDGAVYGGSIQVEQLIFNPLAGGRIRVGIGQSSYTLTTTRPRGTETLTIEPISHLPNSGILYDVSVENVGSSDIKVHYLCITEGDAQVIKACLFDNYSFDLGLSGWDTGGASVSGLPGSIGLEHGEWIKQAITLNPGADGPHIYEIEIDVQVSNAGGQIAMQWGSDGAGGGFVAPGIGQNTRTFTGTLTVSSGATQDFQITAYVPDQTGPSTSGAVTINRVCIGGPYPGQGGGGVDLGIPEGCGEVAFPAGGDVQTVLQWHWYQFDQFHRCVFIPKLHEIYKSVERGFNDLVQQFKFWRQVLYSAAAWSENQLFPWLAGYLSNISPGTIIVENTGCHDIFCLLTSLIDSILRPIVDLVVGLISQAANLLFSVIAGLLTIFITLIGQALALVMTALQIFFGLVQQFIEAEPIPIPGLPNCANTPGEGICVIWWVMDNTLLSGPGAAIIPLIVSILYIEYALWMIAEIKAIIIRSAASL